MGSWMSDNDKDNLEFILNSTNEEILKLLDDCPEDAEYVRWLVCTFLSELKVFHMENEDDIEMDMSESEMLIKYIKEKL